MVVKRAELMLVAVDLLVALALVLLQRRGRKGRKLPFAASIEDEGVRARGKTVEKKPLHSGRVRCHRL